MRPRALIAGGAVVVAALVAWRTVAHQRTTFSEHVALPADANVVGATRTPTPVLSVERTERTRDEADTAAPTPDAALDLPTIRHGLDELHGRIRDVVAPCFAAVADAGAQRIAFRYRLHVKQQRAYIEEPQIYESTFELGETAACFEKALVTLDWELAMPDMTTPVQDELVGDEL